MTALKNGCTPNCPGCAMSHLSYNETLNYKNEYILKFLFHWQKVIAAIQYLDFSENHAYRNKVSLSAIYNENMWSFGMMRKEVLIPIPRCPLHAAKINEALDFLSKCLPPFDNFPLVNYTQVDNQIILVLKTREIPDMTWFWNNFEVAKKLGWEAVWFHLNPVAGKKVFHKYKWELVYGTKFSVSDGGYYTARAFQQLIPELYARALNEVVQFFDINENAAVVDLYSGTGISVKQWHSYGAEVIGVELSGDAVKCATLNNPQSIILHGSCLQRLPQINNWLHNKRKSCCFVFANPPRIGLEQQVAEWLLQAQPIKMAYLSCSPSTLQRDLFIIQSRYEIKKIIPYDFFPYTRHVEILVLAEKKPH